MANRRSRLPRIEHTDDYHLEDETAHLWAVSYADFLMVLLSFFILFFSTDDQTKDDIIERISKTTEKMGVVGSADSSSVSAQTGRGGFSSVDVDALAQILKQRNVTIEKLRRKIIFKFDDNIYGLGEFKLNSESQTELFAVLDLLKPYFESVDITIVGHTDSRKMRQRQSQQLIKNNFDLSVFRATRALEAAITHGAPIEALAAKGSADFRRNSRTLSLVVTPRNIE